MDVIASGMEACPWGLNGYGFDSYIATTPGNAILALARYWADSATAILAAEERFPGRCVRVRYEDLVIDPERTADQIFNFLDATPAPGISARCFSAERERFGPGDHKIWYTSTISSSSIGRGWSIPATLISPQVLTTINELTAKLGYMPVDGEWGTSAPPADLRLTVGDTDLVGSEVHSIRDEAVTSAVSAGAAHANEPAHSRLLGNRLQANLEQLGPEITARWDPYIRETAVAVWIPDNSDGAAEHWLIDLKNRIVTFTTDEAQENSDWDVIGSAGAWEQVIAGNLNLSVALRTCKIRYCDSDESLGGPVASDARIAILAELLGITGW